MATIEFICPACGRKLGVDSSYAGKPGTCPGCGGKIQIPTASEAGGAPAGSPAPASTSNAAGQAPRSIRPAAPIVRASSSSRRRGAPAPKAEGDNKQQLLLIGGGVAVLAIIVVVGLIVFTGGGGAGTESQLLRYVPADAFACGYFDLSEIARSGLLDSVLTGEGNELAEALKKMKLDPKKDLREAVIVGDVSNEPTFVVSGKFDADAIYESAKEAEGSDVDYKGYAVIEDGGNSLLAVVNDGTLLVGGYKPVARKVLDVLKGDAPAIAEDSPILQRAKKVSGKTFWISVDLPEDYDTSETPQLLPGVEAAQVEYMVISGSVKSSGITVEVESGCPDAEAAEAAAKGAEEGIRGFMGMMAMFSADESEGGKAVKRTLDSIKIASSGKTFTMSLTVPAEMITVFASSAEADDDAPMTFDDGDDTFGDDIDEPSDTNEPATGTVADPFEFDELDGPPPIKSTGDIEPEKEE